MNVALCKKLVVAAVVITMSGMLAGLAPSVGQEAKKTDKTEKTEKKAKGVLPAYYGDIVTEEQREKIYAIQTRHKAKIAELNATLAAATKAMNDEIEGVLTAEQKVKLKAAQEAGAAAKKKKAAEKKAAEEGKKAAPAVEAKTTAKPK